MPGIICVLVQACGPAEPPAAAPIRPVRVMSVAPSMAGENVVLTGQVLAQDEVSLSFRAGGRMIERPVQVGDRVKAGQVMAKLEPDTAWNALQSARAALASALAELARTRAELVRQESLLPEGFTTQRRFEIALQAQQSAQAQSDSAYAQLNTARHQFDYTTLLADSDGVVTARGAEPGEVVAAGRMIVQLARVGGRDAVFDVPARVIEAAPADAAITVALAGDPSVRAIGRVREVSPQADPVTRTFQVRVGLTDPPPAMRLGSTVTGSVQLTGAAGIEIPASALMATNRQPAVWIVDPASKTVSLRPVDVERFDLARVTVAQGLAPNDVVVTAGVQSLRPGQKVRLLGDTQ